MSGYARGETEHWKGNVGRLNVDWVSKGASKAKVAAITGECPGCNHPISKELDAVEDRAGVVAEPLPASLAGTYLVTCNCVFSHENAPDGVRGCGAQGGVTISVDGGGDWKVEHTVIGPAERDVDDWAEAAAEGHLQGLRALASQWSAVLSTVTGLVAFGTILDADETLYGLDDRVLGLVCLLLSAGALAAAVVAVIFAARASGPRRLPVVKADLASRLELHKQTVASTSNDLRNSRILSVAALILLAAALGIRFYG